jgi:hypothetical protein
MMAKLSASRLCTLPTIFAPATRLVVSVSTVWLRNARPVAD